jgi:murein DD-endopeptidase MepM/ murein hydrolase activator NlpD
VQFQRDRRKPGLIARISALLPEREIFLRSGGQVRFLRISRRAQILSISAAAILIICWGGATLNMLADKVAVERDRAALATRGKAVASQAGQVATYRRSVGDLAKDLEARQDFMDDLYKTHFGTEDAELSPDKAAKKEEAPATKVSAGPDAPLRRIEERQGRFARLLTAAVDRRAQKAATAIRSFGLNPDTLARNAASAQGGPFVPWRGERDALSDDLKDLASALARMELLERSLIAIPSGQPTATPMLSSSYGFRRDPFNGHAAFHAGIDFPGRFGQPILAAARGRISYVGQRQGYGNVVEVQHGNGLMTRYAHLSGFAAKVGQSISTGAMIGRMGSTGRSTGTHLHFEVRLNDQAINPRRFLEAAQDVLQVQQIAQDRFADVRNRG